MEKATYNMISFTIVRDQCKHEARMRVYIWRYLEYFRNILLSKEKYNYFREIINLNFATKDDKCLLSSFTINSSNKILETFIGLFPYKPMAYPACTLRVCVGLGS
jgi:hypothetical protein